MTRGQIYKMELFLTSPFALIAKYAALASLQVAETSFDWVSRGTQEQRVAKTTSGSAVISAYLLFIFHMLFWDFESLNSLRAFAIRSHKCFNDLNDFIYTVINSSLILVRIESSQTQVVLIYNTISDVARMCQAAGLVEDSLVEMWLSLPRDNSSKSVWNLQKYLGHLIHATYCIFRILWLLWTNPFL